MFKIKGNTFEFKMILLHVLMGFIVFVIPLFSKAFSLATVLLSLMFVFRAKNKTVAILTAAAYIATSDVFFRMTSGLILYETHKYMLIVLAFLGMVFEFGKIKGYIYLIYITLLFVSLVFTEYYLTEEIRKMIAFNLSGPVSLGIFALFAYRKQISMAQLQRVLFFALLPVLSMVIYMFFYTPSVKDVVTGTASNFATSGGFGPNQVATILGVGMFVGINRLVLRKASGLQFVIELALLFLMAYRGLATFSRGGILTSLFAIGIFLVLLYFKADKNFISSLNRKIVIAVVLGVGVWFYTLTQTSGLIENRYSNKNALGVEKEDISTGRKELFLLEVDAFFESPIFGIGIGKNKEYKFKKTGVVAATHNEISRLVAEHGTFGIFALLILILTPLSFRLENRKSLYFYSFLLFWFLTINHSAMRIAFPSFIYGLALLDVNYNTSKPKKKLQPVN